MEAATVRESGSVLINSADFLDSHIPRDIKAKPWLVVWQRDRYNLAGPGGKPEAEIGDVQQCPVGRERH